MAAHLVDQPHVDLGAVKVGIEQRQPLGLALDLVDRRGAGQQQHLVGHLGRRDPDLLAIDQIAAVLALGPGLERRGVEAGIGLGDGEAGLVAATYDPGDKALLLFLGAEQDHGLEPKDVDVDRRGAAHARAGLGDRLHHDRGFGDPQTRAAIGLRHGDAQPAGVSQRAVEILGKHARLVSLQPVLVRELRAVLEDGVSDVLLVWSEREIHDFSTLFRGIGLPRRVAAVARGHNDPAGTYRPCGGQADGFSRPIGLAAIGRLGSYEWTRNPRAQAPCRACASST